MTSSYLAGIFEFFGIISKEKTLFVYYFFEIVRWQKINIQNCLPNSLEWYFHHKPNATMPLVLCIWFCFQYLGNFKTGEAEFLTGKSYSREFPVIFWPVFMAITSIISMSGIVAILIKKWLSNRAHKKMIQGIHIALEDQNENQENSQVQYLLSFSFCVLSST